MSDPLASVTPGAVSPFVTRADTVNRVLEAARAVRRGERGGGGGSPELDPINPACVVYVRNDTGGSLANRSVVALGTPVISAANYPLDVSRQPTFPGTTPAAATDPFAVLLEPLASGAVGAAVILGAAVCELAVNAAAHGYAAPVASSSAALGSAAGGPAKIIWKNGTSGTVRAVVLIQGGSGDLSGPAAPEEDSVPTFDPSGDLQNTPLHVTNDPVNGDPAAQLKLYATDNPTTATPVVQLQTAADGDGAGTPQFTLDFYPTGTAGGSAGKITAFDNGNGQITLHGYRVTLHGSLTAAGGVIGALAATEAGDTLTATGGRGIAGTLAATEAGDTLSATGTNAAGGGSQEYTSGSGTFTATYTGNHRIQCWGAPGGGGAGGGMSGGGGGGGGAYSEGTVALTASTGYAYAVGAGGAGGTAGGNGGNGADTTFDTSTVVAKGGNGGSATGAGGGPGTAAGSTGTTKYDGGVGGGGDFMGGGAGGGGSSGGTGANGAAGTDGSGPTGGAGGTAPTGGGNGGAGGNAGAVGTAGTAPGGAGGGGGTGANGGNGANGKIVITWPA